MYCEETKTNKKLKISNFIVLTYLLFLVLFWYIFFRNVCPNLKQLFVIHDDKNNTETFFIYLINCISSHTNHITINILFYLKQNAADAQKSVCFVYVVNMSKVGQTKIAVIQFNVSGLV